jgi:isopenicillin-N N-acyltransferase like protein
MSRHVLARTWRWLALALAGALTALAQPADQLRIIGRDPDGHGLLCEHGGKRILLVAGTPEEMGTAHGRLLKSSVCGVAAGTVYLVGAGYSATRNDWFFTRMEEIIRRTAPYTPERFVRECDALSSAAGISARDGRAANFFPELFHCSGVAVRNAATADGMVLHARVLDYMREIHLQKHAVIQVWMPTGFNAWMSLGYAGFIGTVTCMNEKGLAIGEMGGGGEGKWDGMPMNLLLRDIMERAGTVREAVAIMQKTPRTCEYYYVISDRSRDMVGIHATPEAVAVLEAGAQHPSLPPVPQETVLISAGKRAEALAQRVREHYGKIDVPTLIEIIKRPVAMSSNLHNAIFRPETLDMWCADAGLKTVACDEPYVQVNLNDLVRYFRGATSPAPAP